MCIPGFPSFVRGKRREPLANVVPPDHKRARPRRRERRKRADAMVTPARTGPRRGGASRRSAADAHAGRPLGPRAAPRPATPRGIGRAQRSDASTRAQRGAGSAPARVRSSLDHDLEPPRAEREGTGVRPASNEASARKSAPRRESTTGTRIEERHRQCPS